MEKIFELLGSYHFPTAIITLILAPLGLFLGQIVLKHLKAWGEFIFEGLFYSATKIVKHSVGANFILKRYCRLQLAEQSRYLHVPSAQDVKLEIDKVYVTLSLETQFSEEPTYNHVNLFEVGNRLRIVGDPGSGKSSLVKRLYRDACRKGIDNPREGRFPILIELKNLSVPNEIEEENCGEWIFHFINKEIEKLEIYQIIDCFNNYSKTSGVLILLDGLDEVSTKEYPKIEAGIKGLSKIISRLSENSIIILTLRSQFHQQVKESFRDNFGQALFLKPFSPTDIYLFLKNWPYHLNPEKNATRIYKELADKPTLREMCRNPLVLSMYVAEDQARGNLFLPETRTEFYLKISEELLIRRRIEQKGPMPARKFLLEQRQKILGRLAFNHLVNLNESKNSLSWPQAVSEVETIMNCEKGKGEGEKILQEVAKETGLIVEERSGETFRFIHLTLCEFLGALYAIQGKSEGWNELIDLHKEFSVNGEPQTKTRLLDVIPFACGLLNPISRPQGLTAIAELQDNRLFLRCLLETKLYDHPYRGTISIAESQRILGEPVNNEDYDWFHDLHLIVVVAKDSIQCAEHRPGFIKFNLEEFFENLVNVKRDTLGKILGAQANEDAVSVFHIAENCHFDLLKDHMDLIVKNCDQIPFLSLVLEKAFKDLPRIHTWACVFLEAALKSNLVAKALAQMPRTPELEKYIIYKNDFYGGRWGLGWNFGIINMEKKLLNSLFGQIRNIGLNSHETSVPSFPAIQLVREFISSVKLQRKIYFFSLPTVFILNFLGAILFGLILGFHDDFQLKTYTGSEKALLLPFFLFDSTFSFAFIWFFYFSHGVEYPAYDNFQPNSPSNKPGRF